MIRVGLVDDDDMVLRWLRQHLTRENALDVAFTARTAAEALQLVYQIRVDVLVADLNMPAPGGVWLTAQMKRSHPTVPVLILSAREQEGCVLRAFDAGASGYLLKSADTCEIVAAVCDIANGRTYRGKGVPELGPVRTRSVPLTPREEDVLLLLAEGLRNEEIARRLGIEDSTVKKHRQNIRDKTGCDTPVELRRYAEDRGLLFE